MGIKSAYKKLLAQRTPEEVIAHDALLLSARFLSEISILMEQKSINKKMLAEKTGVSSAYITNLFRGNKLLNMEMIARLEKALDLKFQVKAFPKRFEVADKTYYYNFHQSGSKKMPVDIDYTQPDIYQDSSMLSNIHQTSGVA